MDIIIGTLGGILVAHFTSNRNSQYGGNANEDVLDQLHGLGRRKELRRGVQGKTCYNVLELNDVDIANYLRENKDHFVIHLGGKKYDACNSLENMRDTYSFEADGKKSFKVWYACNNNDGRLGPQNIDRSVEYVNMTQTFSTFVEKPKWVYRGRVPEPRVFHLQKIGERKGMISNHILDFNDSLISGDHCNQRTSVSIYRLVAGHKNNKNTQVKVYSDGKKYNGDLKEGMRHGQGVYTWPDGTKYNGEWKDDMRHGRGVMTWSDGRKYNGEWKNDMSNGIGVMTWPDGMEYEGELENDMMHGQGVMVYSDGRKYEGEWKDDKRHGRGVTTWPNGIKYDGDRVGLGDLTYPDGDKAKTTGRWIEINKTNILNWSHEMPSTITNMSRDTQSFNRPRGNWKLGYE